MVSKWLERTLFRARTALAVVWTVLWLFVAAAVDAEPMDLADTRARWVAVRFEVSPASLPGQVDTIYSQPFPARFEPIGDGRVRLTIDSEIVEAHLLGTQVPVPGSFSDFEWVFDAASGQVLSASLRGKLSSEIGIGALSTDFHSDVKVQMSTETRGGFELARQVLKERFHPFCNEAQAACTLVQPSRYRPDSGYVNAVGELQVDAPFVQLRTFSPLGEAIFSELPDWPHAEPEFTRPALVVPTALDAASSQARLEGPIDH